MPSAGRIPAASGLPANGQDVEPAGPVPVAVGGLPVTHNASSPPLEQPNEGVPCPLLIRAAWVFQVNVNIAPRDEWGCRRGDTLEGADDFHLASRRYV